MVLGRAALVGLGWAMLVLSGYSLQAQTLEQSPVDKMPQRTPRGLANAEDTPYRTPEATSEGVLREMGSRASVIFAGTVTAVIKGTDKDLQGSAGSSVVEVDFAVDHAVKGVAEGSAYAMREWAGMWRDSPRFTVGQRLLMLLHGAGPGGLSSPVDGLDGAIPIKTTTVLPSFADPSSGLAANAAGKTVEDDVVDMRWLQARTLRAQTYADEPVAAPGEGSPAGLSALASRASADAITPTEPATTAGLTHVLGLLMSGRETGNVSH